MPKLSPPQHAPDHACEDPCILRERREKNMTMFITLLGTYSLNEHEPVISIRHSKPNDEKAESARYHGQLERLLIASSCDTLRGMISHQSRSMSSFPALVLNSFGWGQVAPDAAEKEEVASFYVGRPIVLSPTCRVDMASYVKNDTNSELCSQNCVINDYDKADAEGKKRSALESNRLVGIKHYKADTEGETPATANSNLADHETISQFDEVPATVNSSLAEDQTSTQLDEVDFCTAIQTVEDIARVPYLMMSNFSSSFALLIEARLRAYGNILKRHIAAFSHDSHFSPQIYVDGDHKSFLASHDGCPLSTEIKLNTLVAIGEHMEVNGVVTTFHVQQCTPVLFPKNWKNIKSVDDNILTLPIKFEAIVDISIPGFRENAWQLDKDTLSIQTTGTITGCYEESSHSLLSQVHLELDTHTLVSQMIDKACEVVLKATQNANAAISETKSSPSMPQEREDQVNLPGIEKSTSSHVIDNLTNNVQTSPAQHYTMVTPELKPRASAYTPSEFTLEGEESVSAKNRHVDKDCAAIIDYAIGDFLS